MGLQMVFQSIWPFEASGTIGILTEIGSFFGMDDNVSFHIRFKAKDFFTAGKKAFERSLVVRDSF